MAFTKYNSPLPSGEPIKERKPPEKIKHISREITRIYRNFPDIFWNSPEAPRPLFIRTPPETIPAHLRKGYCITKALTADNSIYRAITQIQSGPNTSVLETSLTRWYNEGALKYGETIESWLQKYYDAGWNPVPRSKVGSRTHKGPAKIRKPRELDFGAQLLKDRADQKALQSKISEELRFKSRKIGNFMDKMDKLTKEINEKYNKTKEK